MAIVLAAKDPDETLSYRVDFAARLGTGDALATKVVSLAVEAGATLGASDLDETGVDFFLSGGTLNLEAAVLVRVTTDLGLTLDEVGLIKIRTRGDD